MRNFKVSNGEIIEEITTTVTAVVATKVSHNDLRNSILWCGKSDNTLIKDMADAHIHNVVAYLVPMKCDAMYKGYTVLFWYALLTNELHYRDYQKKLNDAKRLIASYQTRLDTM